MNNQLQTAIKNELIYQFQMFELNWIHWISMKDYDKRSQFSYWLWMIVVEFVENWEKCAELTFYYYYSIYARFH